MHFPGDAVAFLRGRRLALCLAGNLDFSEEGERPVPLGLEGSVLDSAVGGTQAPAPASKPSGLREITITNMPNATEATPTPMLRARPAGRWRGRFAAPASAGTSPRPCGTKTMVVMPAAMVRLMASRPAGRAENRLARIRQSPATTISAPAVSLSATPGVSMTQTTPAGHHRRGAHQAAAVEEPLRSVARLSGCSRHRRAFLRACAEPDRPGFPRVAYRR